MAICKKCRWYRRLINFVSDDLPTCKSPDLVQINAITGSKTYPYCKSTNSEGECSSYLGKDQEPFHGFET